MPLLPLTRNSSTQGGSSARMATIFPIAAGSE
jgi:hypothetical protein